MGRKTGKTGKALFFAGVFFLCGFFGAGLKKENAFAERERAFVEGKGAFAERERAFVERKGALIEKENAFVQKGDNPYGWDKIASYTTYYSVEDGGRCENIAVAASLVDGVTLQAYGEFSFNATVGKRTESAGFQQAKIIVNGEYVAGVGGGVCQVSTTLYNAALKAGLTVTEFHPHSLKVGYVSPSRDAMVSTGSDLKLFNPHSYPVFLSAQLFEGGVRIVFFGKNEGYRYEITSNILAEIPPPEPIIKEGERDEIIRSPKNGVKSEAFLECYQGERLIFKKRLRTDEYRPIQGIIGKKVANTTN